MQEYIGAKIILAEEMDERTFHEKFQRPFETGTHTRPGYHVQYPGGYDSWSPKEVFEEAYRPVSQAEKDMRT